MKVVVAAGLAASLLLAACTSASPPPKTTSGTSTSGTSSRASSSSAPAPDLSAQLLGAADLPQGWRIDTSASASTSNVPPCIAAVKAKLHTTTKAERDFIAGQDFPTFEQEIGYFGSSSAARAVFAAGVSVLNACSSLDFTTSDGIKFTGTIAQLTLETFGDESAAWRIALNAQGVTLAIDAVLLQKGAELEALFYGNVGSVDAIPLTTFVKKTVAKLPA